MTISKVQSGKHEVQLTKKANQSLPKDISFEFIALMEFHRKHPKFAVLSLHKKTYMTGFI